MGRVGAFIGEGRVAHGERPFSETTGDYDEFAVPLAEDVQRVQASRCMYCGVAFCQTGFAFGSARSSGCPLHNLIPEWNDLVWRGRWSDAAERLSLTNPLPEFTGRVCPAPCEAACNLGLNDEPTTIKDDERAISDHLWATGGPAPLEPAPVGAPRVAVVGSGPAGLACSWELARRGCSVTLVERHDRAGGLLMYGIPNMKLPKDVVTRRLDLMRESGIEVRCGVDACDDAVAAGLLADFDAVVVAAGAADARRLRVPGADLAGVHLAVEYLTAQTRALLDGDAANPDICARDLDVIVVGGGDTGTDCVATALRQGARSVHQLEFLPAPPESRAATNLWPEWPNVKKTDYGQIEATIVQGSDPRSWATDTLEVVEGEDGGIAGLRVASLDWSKGKPQRIEGSERVLPAQLVLLAMGFAGPERSVLDSLGVEVTDFRGGVRPVLADAAGHRASSSGRTPVYVAGDARNGSTLVVSAMSDGLACAGEVASALLR